MRSKRSIARIVRRVLCGAGEGGGRCEVGSMVEVVEVVADVDVAVVVLVVVVTVVVVKHSGFTKSPRSLLQLMKTDDPSL